MIKTVLLLVTLVAMFAIILIGINQLDKDTRQFERKCKEEEDLWR